MYPSIALDTFDFNECLLAICTSRVIHESLLRKKQEIGGAISRSIVLSVRTEKRHCDDDRDVGLAYTLIKHRRRDITAQFCTDAI